jgi:hypothetical protein
VQDGPEVPEDLAGLKKLLRKYKDLLAHRCQIRFFLRGTWSMRLKRAMQPQSILGHIVYVIAQRAGEADCRVDEKGINVGKTRFLGVPQSSLSRRQMADGECVDYRGLNLKTRKNTYPLLLIQYYID